MGEVIVITSGKGGVGKTTNTANIGNALAGIGKKVVLVDGDTGLRNLDILMGLENRIVYNLIDVIEEKCSLKQALIKDKKYENLYLLSTSQTKNKNDIKPEEMSKLIDELKCKFDYILIDSPAGIEQGFDNAIMGADRALIVVNPELTSIRDAYRVIGMLKERGVKNQKVIVNKIDYEMVKNGEMLDADDIVNNLDIELIGIIPMDKLITISTNTGQPISLNRNSKVGRAFNEIAIRITGEQVPFEYYKQSDSRFAQVIRKLFVTN